MIKRRARRGALELSMNTIVVIVIAAIVLSLGIVFVKNIFPKLEIFSGKAFEQAEGEIDKLGTSSGELLTLSPSETEVKKGSSTTTKVIVANQETEPLSFKLKSTSQDSTLRCIFADTLKDTSKQYNLDSGEEATVKMIIDEKNGALGMKVCSIEVQSTQRLADNSDELIIKVIKD